MGGVAEIDLSGTAQYWPAMPAKIADAAFELASAFGQPVGVFTHILRVFLHGQIAFIGRSLAHPERLDVHVHQEDVMPPVCSVDKVASLELYG